MVEPPAAVDSMSSQSDEIITSEESPSLVVPDARPLQMGVVVCGGAPYNVYSLCRLIFGDQRDAVLLSIQRLVSACIERRGLSRHSSPLIHPFFFHFSQSRGYGADENRDWQCL